MDEARRAVDEQGVNLEAMRNRAVGLLGVVGLAAGLVGLPTHAAVRSVFFVAFVALLAEVVVILWPRKATRAMGVNKIRADDGWAGLTDAEYTEHLAMYHGRTHEEQEKLLETLSKFLVAAIILSGACVVLLVFGKGE